MTPGALAVRERVRPPSMTRVIASLAELGLRRPRVRIPTTVGRCWCRCRRRASELIEAERRASREWLQQRLGRVHAEERKILLTAADLMTAIVDESA